MTIHQILFYTTVENFVEKREPYRNQHLKLVQASFEKGELIKAGALIDPVDKAVLIFKSDRADIAEQFALNDPYVINGLITSWEVRSWTVVVGAD